MSKNYHVKVNDTSEFTIPEIEVNNLNTVSTDNSKFHIIYENQSLKAEIIETDFNQKEFKVKVNNSTYNVTIFNDLDLLIKEMGFEIGSSIVINEIKAPMPGLILDIHVKTGQEVQENDALLILEAMKMENVITSPRDGIIKNVSVKNGDAIEKNHLLIEFE